MEDACRVPYDGGLSHRAGEVGRSRVCAIYGKRPSRASRYVRKEECCEQEETRRYSARSSGYMPQEGCYEQEVK